MAVFEGFNNTREDGFLHTRDVEKPNVLSRERINGNDGYDQLLKRERSLGTGVRKVRPGFYYDGQYVTDFSDFNLMSRNNPDTVEHTALNAETTSVDISITQDPTITFPATISYPFVVTLAEPFYLPRREYSWFNIRYLVHIAEVTLTCTGDAEAVYDAGISMHTVHQFEKEGGKFDPTTLSYNAWWNYHRDGIYEIEGTMTAGGLLSGNRLGLYSMYAYATTNGPGSIKITSGSEGWIANMMGESF